jgi:hypothetical protein
MAIHLDVVQQVHDDLIAKGVVLNGSRESQFEQTKRVVWALRGQGYGLLRKKRGNTNFHGYALDAIVDSTGDIIDILRSDGAPQWLSGRGHATPAQFAAPFDPDGPVPDGYLDAVGPQPLDPVKNPEPDKGRDAAYITQMIHAAYAARADLPRDDVNENMMNGFPNEPDIAFWLNLVLNQADYWGANWYDRVLRLDRTTGSGGSGTGGVSQGGGARGALVNAQLGLLEDDIVYRLALLAVNVLQPLKGAYPNIVVVSGFRQVNTGIGQHELGESVDLQIRNQTDAQLFEVADYIRKNLNFDQLVLNWTDLGDKQGWIHVSFSPTTLRGQVLTKDFADAFHDGLFLCQQLSGEERAAALRAQAADDAEVVLELQTMQSRQQRFSDTTANEDVPADQQRAGPGANAGAPGGDSNPSPGPDTQI